MKEERSPSPAPEEVPIQDKRRFTAEGEPRECEAEQAGAPEQAAAEETDAGDDRTEELTRALAEIEQRAARAEEKLRDYTAACDEFRREAERAGMRARQEVRDTLAPVFIGLLDALDDLERTFLHAEEGPLREGVGLVQRKFVDVLSSCGVERLELTGEPFSPDLAEAVYAVEVEDEQEKGKVLEELRPGYRWKEGVLRPAQVKVGR